MSFLNFIFAFKFKTVSSTFIHIIVICTLLVGWLFLLADGLLLLYFRRKEKDAMLVFYIVSILWAATAFNVLYEGLFLNEGISLLPSLNSWAFTCITPLLFLYFRCRITGDHPDTQQWTLHLTAPAILLLLYGIGSSLGTSPDQLTYTWNDLVTHNGAWWIYFRMGCYLVLLLQVAIYLPYLFGRNGIWRCESQAAPLIEKEITGTLIFGLIALTTLLTPFLICDLVYNLSIILAAGYVFYRSVSYQIIRQKLALFTPSIPAAPPFPIPEEPEEEAKKTIEIFSPKQEMLLTERLADRQFLCNPELTINLLARELLTNETYLSRYFNRQLGISFPKFITAERLREAERLLDNKELTILEVAEQAGFQTLSAFYLAFTTKHNYSPSQWRKKHQSE